MVCLGCYNFKEAKKGTTMEIRGGNLKPSSSDAERGLYPEPQTLKPNRQPGKAPISPFSSSIFKHVQTLLQGPGLLVVFPNGFLHEVKGSYKGAFACCSGEPLGVPLKVPLRGWVPIRRATVSFSKPSSSSKGPRRQQRATV